METIINRIDKYLTHTNTSIRKFEVSIGISNGSISKAIKKGTDIQSKWISKIIDTHKDLNPAWLLTGDGNMQISNLKAYYLPEISDLGTNEEKGSYGNTPKNLFIKLKDTTLTSDQIKMLEVIENNYDMLLHQNIKMQDKIIQLYETKGQ